MVNKKKSSKKTKKHLDTTQKVVITVIVATFLVMTAAALVAYFCDTKFQIEAKITDLANTYYEEYYYPNMFSGNVSISEVLSQFKDSGLAPVSLRQLLISTPGVTSQDAKLIREYCDEESTNVTYFPEPPYDKGAFRAKYSYSCNF